MQTTNLSGHPGGDEDTQFNGGDLTDQEKAALAAKEEGEGKTAEEEAAERAEQERQEQERADQERAAREAEEAKNAATAAAAAAAAAQPQEPGDAPAAPEDFAAARAKAEADMDNGLTSAVEFQRELDRIREADAAHKQALSDHAASVAAFDKAQQDREAAKKANDDAWADDYNGFAKDNAEFMSNPLYVRDMQTVIDDILRTDPGIDNAKLLAEAYDKVSKYHKYEKPAPAADAITGALKDRHQQLPGQTLGDAPAAQAETITGNESFDALDRLPIDKLEDVVANMSPAQLEKYLGSAPGANATGRD